MKYVHVFTTLERTDWESAQVKEDRAILTDDHASSEVWQAPSASLYNDVVTQPISHALQAQDHPLFPC